MIITARYPGKCKSCGGRIGKGAKIAWAKGSGARHVECGEGSEVRRSGPIDSSPGARASYYDPRGVYAVDGTYLGSTGPRCEDAPCCGCC